MTITYLVGDATKPIETSGRRAIVHVCNNVGGWGRGFVVAISKRWQTPERTYRTSKNSRTLSEIQVCEVDDDVCVINMIAQEGYGSLNRNAHRSDEPDARLPIRYDALKTCLEKVAEQCRTNSATVHMPRIGCGLAGGSWDLVEPIILETLHDIDVYVYDLA